MAGIPGRYDVDRARHGHAVHGHDSHSREDVRVATLLRRQARGHGRAHRALRSAPCAGQPVRRSCAAARSSSPDIRAGMAMLIAALCAEGESTINNVGQIERGYERIDERLRALGANDRARGGAARVMSGGSIVGRVGGGARARRRSAFGRSRRRATSAVSGRMSEEPVRAVMGRWSALRDELRVRRITASRPRFRCTARRFSSTNPDGRAGSEATRPTDIVSVDRGTGARRHGRRLRSRVHRASVRRGRAAPLRLARDRGSDRRAGHRGVQRARLRGASSCSIHTRPGDLRQLLRGECRRLCAAHRDEPGSTDDDRSPRVDRRSRARSWRQAHHHERVVYSVQQRSVLLPSSRRHGPPARRHDQRLGELTASDAARSSAGSFPARASTALDRTTMSGARPLPSKGFLSLVYSIHCESS